jgi:tetratricopeptide (TPR) repeat protein
MHRALKLHLLHLVDDAGEGKLQSVFHGALTMVRALYPRGAKLQTPTNEIWQDCEQALPHVLSLLHQFHVWAPKFEANLDLATLLADTANYLWERQLMQDAIKIMDAGEEVCNSLSAINEVIPVHANICAIYGALLCDLGFSGRADALMKCEKALELRKKHIENLEASGKVEADDILLLANAWNDVGVVLLEEEKFESAMPYFEEALRLKTEWSNEDAIPWHFGEGYKNLAYIKLSQGLAEEAKSCAFRSTELCMRGRAENSATSLFFRFVCAHVLLNCNEIDQALAMHQDILEARNEVFGNTHPLTKDSLYTIGEIYRIQGKMAKAE